MGSDSSLPLSIGLTGGIGSGKTAVSDAFAKLGVQIIDTDILSRELVRPGSATLKKITEYFGNSILLESGELDRRRLRDIIFTDLEKKTWLEQLLHPEISQLVHKALAACTGDYVMVVVPLLFETGQYAFLDRVLVVDSPENLQLQRVLARDKTNPVQAERIMAEQLGRLQRLALADDIIVNDGSLADLQEKVNELHEQYRRLSKQKNH